MAREVKFLTAIRHPSYLDNEQYWDTWRDCYEGGEYFLNKNLRQFSTRESNQDFLDRKAVTPIPTFAKAAVNDVRNAIFQRLRDVTRRDGSDNYMRAAAGEIGGVDNKGSSMQSFLGVDVLTELLVMGRVGIYVDMPAMSNFRTMADEGNVRPYCYVYKVEDILSWAAAKPEEPGEFTAILLRDRGIDYNQGFSHVRLPQGGFERYRLMWVDPDTRTVKMRLFDEDDNLINRTGSVLSTPDEFDPDSNLGVVNLDLERIPFIMPDIGSSIIKDVCKHQVALLNLGSADVAYALRSNFPFYIEQKDLRDVGRHLKQYVDDDGTTNTSDNSTPGSETRVGSSYGKAYDIKAEAPSFIHPSPEPLEASIKLQEKLEDDIRKLVQLAVQNKTGSRAISAEALKLSDQGLEAGLSYIGLVLENAERQVATHWASYESRDPSRRQIATIKYPDRYSLKDDDDRIKEAKALSELIYTVPGKEAKNELAKCIVSTLLSGRVSTTAMNTIYKQIDEAGYATSDPDTILRAVEQGLCGEQTGSIAIGFGPEEYLQARKDHAARAARVAAAQSSARGENMAARGVEDLDPDTNSGKEERAEVNDTTLSDDKKPPVRGDGKSLKKGEDNGG